MKTKQVKAILCAALALLSSISVIEVAASQKHRLAIAESAPELITNSENSFVANTPAIMALAKHLKKVGAKMYGAYWCPHCTHQKEMFGGAAFRNVDYVECDPRGKSPRPNLCKAANIKGYPTWEIQGKMYVGVQSFEELAKASGYKGSHRFYSSF